MKNCAKFTRKQRVVNKPQVQVHIVPKYWNEKESQHGKKFFFVDSSFYERESKRKQRFLLSWKEDQSWIVSWFLKDNFLNLKFLASQTFSNYEISFIEKFCKVHKYVADFDWK